MRKNNKISVSLENAILNVTSSLKRYEPEYRSLLRHPHAGMEGKERIHTYSQYIECRLNYELYSIPELFEIAPNFDGHLFNVVSVQGANEKTKTYSQIRATLNTGCTEYLGEDLEEDIQRVREALGGDTIVIINSRRVPTIRIEE